MKLIFVVIGLCMVVSATVLTAIGRYDGVLGTDDPNRFLAAGGGEGTFRLEVTGTSEDASSEFMQFRQELVVPQPMRERMDGGQFVPVRILDAREPVDGYMLVRGFVPAVGDVLIVSGSVATEWPLFDAGGVSLASMPVLFIQPDEYHAPILFKR